MARRKNEPLGVRIMTVDENGNTVQTQAAIQKDSRAESFFFMEIILSSEIGLISPFKLSC